MKKTLIVLGAGGSKNVHHTFPTGIELAISLDAHLITLKKKQNDPNNHPECPYVSPMLNESKRVFGYNVAELDELADQLKIELWAYAREYDYHYYRDQAPTISIDQLVSSKFSSHAKVFNLAKQCVAYLLKGQEDAYLDACAKSSDHKDKWIQSIYSILKDRGASLQDILTNVAVISFNYERLFEYRSCIALNDLFGVKLTTLPNIQYIYGNFGNLVDVPFEVKNNQPKFRNHCYQGMKFIVERHQLVNRPNLDSYDRVLFIGFGYDKDNLTDTLSIQKVKTAELIGMCRSKSSFYSEIEKAFKIKMVETGNDIMTFIEKTLG